MRTRISLTLAATTLALTACAGNVFDLAEGTCFNDEDTTADEISSVPIVECDEPHDNEIFATFQLDDGDFPGQAEVQETGMAGCLERFDAWAGTTFPESTLLVFPITPTAESWDQLDDREVACGVYDQDGNKLTGSMKGAGV